MARLFNGTTEWLEVSSALITGYPFAISVWFRLDVLPTTHGDEMTLFSVSDFSTSFIDFWNLRADDTADLLQFTMRAQAGAARVSEVSTTLVAGVWNHALVSGLNASSRSLWLNGAGKDTNTNEGTPTNLDRTTIGALTGNDAHTDEIDGRIGEVAIYNRAFSDSEAAAIGTGAPASKFSGLTHYWLVQGVGSPEPDYIGTDDMVVTGSAVADHPPVPPPLAEFYAIPTSQGLEPAVAAYQRMLVGVGK